MNKRYEVRRNDDGIVLIYKYGFTEVQCNSSTGRTIVINEAGGKYEDQYDRIFDLGEFKKFEKHIINRRKEQHPGNPHAFRFTFVAQYLPKMAKEDIKAESPSEKNDLIGKYFK